MTCNNKLNKHRKLKTFESQGRLHSSKPATDAAFGNLSCALRKTDLIKPWWNPQFFLPESSSQAYQRGDRSAVLMLVLHKQPGQIRIRLERLSQWLVPSSASPLPLDKSWRVYLKAMCLVLSVDDTLPLSQKSGASSRIMWMQLVLCKQARKIQDGKFHEISKRCWMLAVDTLSKTKRTILQFWVEAVPSLRPLWLVSLVSSVHPMHRKSRSDPSSETDSKGIFHLHSLDRVNLNFLSVDRWLPGAAATAIKSYKIAL